MNLGIFHVGLSLGLGFLLLFPLTRIVHERNASAPTATVELPQEPTFVAGAAKWSAPQFADKVLAPGKKTRCERDAKCVDLRDDILGHTPPIEASPSTERNLAGHAFQCESREKRSGGIHLSCTLKTNARTEAEHHQAVRDVLGALRDRHGAENGLRTQRTSEYIKEYWDWSVGKRNGSRGSFRLHSLWRYNPSGLGVPNAIKLTWQTGIR